MIQLPEEKNKDKEDYLNKVVESMNIQRNPICDIVVWKDKKENSEFFKDARKFAEGLSKEELVEIYLAEVEVACDDETENKLLRKRIKVLERALELACKEYFEFCGFEDCPVGENNFEYDKCKDCKDEYTSNRNGKCWYKYHLEQAEKEIEND